MPSEEIIQVVGTLIPQESRTLLSNQLAQGVFLKMTQKQQSFRKEPKLKRKIFYNIPQLNFVNIRTDEVTFSFR
ncbi:hypothetical protein ACTWQL_03210 [Pseudalkalibacillus sp. R45]|uniref:hypothetical protein n=1 Tax=Pseudalkalibacillus sp. R45 TaxID=3457433 RepID=UPI003FCD5E81